MKLEIQNTVQEGTKVAVIKGSWKDGEQEEFAPLYTALQKPEDGFNKIIIELSQLEEIAEGGISGLAVLAEAADRNNIEMVLSYSLANNDVMQAILNTEQLRHLVSLTPEAAA